MVKVNTHILIDEDLRDLAKARNISISKTTNDALAFKLAVPNTMEELAVERFKLNEQLKAVDSKESEIVKDAAIKTRHEVLEGMNADVKELRQLWAKKLNNEISDVYWAEMVSKFCEIWQVERAVAVQYAEGKKEVIG